MSLWSRFKGLFFSTPDAATAAYSLLESLFPSGVPPRRGTRELLQAVRKLPWLHTAVWKIAFDVARADFCLYKTAKAKQVARARRAIARTGVRRNAVAGVRGATEVQDHPILDVLENPNPLLGQTLTLALIQAYLDTKGEVLVVIERGDDGLPLELWPVPPHWLAATPTVDSPTFKFSWQGWMRDVPEKDVLFLRMPDLENPYARGAGTGESLADELDIDEFAAKHIKSFFFNRALPDAFVSVKGATSTKKLKEEIERFEQEMADKHGGVGKGWRPQYVAGDISVIPIGSSLKDQQMRELRQLQRDTLLQVYGIPPEVVGIVENSNRATIDSALRIYGINVLSPRLWYLADALTQLAREWDPTFFFAFESPVEEDKDFVLKVVVAQPTCFRKNEIRELAGYQRADEFGDDFLEPAAPKPGLPAGEDNNPKALPEGSGPAGEDPSQEGSEADAEEAKSAARLRLTA
jgi:phage portal protein BeeE